MTDDMITLGKRATACKGWRWMAGMKIANGIRVTESLVPFTFAVDVPDLEDPATTGCLLALVREAWEQYDVAAFRFMGRWCVEGASHGDTEAEALVAALEAAPSFTGRSTEVRKMPDNCYDNNTDIKRGEHLHEEEP